MSVIKTVIGGLIGAAVATGIYYAIKQSTGETYTWFPLVTGVLTGVFVRFLAGAPSSKTAGLVSGMFSGLIAGVAIFGVAIGPDLLAMNQIESGPIPRKASSDTGQGAPSAADSEKSAAEDTKTDTKPESEPQDSNGNAAPSAQPAVAADATDKGGAESTTKSADQPTGEPFDPEAEAKKRSSSGKEMAADQSKGMPMMSADANKSSRVKTWYDNYMPWVFSGIGIFLAYQIARGFTDSKKGSGAVLGK